MIFIGIDPDVDKSGFALWRSDEREFSFVVCQRFFTILEKIKYLVETERDEVVVCVEAGWLINKSNWHGSKNEAISARIGKNIGSNHQVGKLFVEFCEINNIKYIEVKPMGKMNAHNFSAITGWEARTNSEMRDAAMLVFGRNEVRTL